MAADGGGRSEKAGTWFATSNNYQTGQPGGSKGVQHLGAGSGRFSLNSRPTRQTLVALPIVKH